MNLLFIFLLTFGFLISGINRDVQNITHLTFFTALILGVYLNLKAKIKLKVPLHFGPVLLFTFIIGISQLFFKDNLNPFNYFLMFTEGIVLWFIFYNSGSKLAKLTPLIMMVPMAFYSLFYLINIPLDLNLLSLAGRFFNTAEILGHEQIGNLSVIVIVYLVGSNLSGKYSLYDLLFYLATFFLLYLSKSRSGYIALATGLGFLFKDRKSVKLILLISILVILFAVIYLSMGRSILLSRVYFVQSILGLLKYPFGVGMGNFNDVSLGYYNAGGVLGSYSDFTHNIFLECLSGAGLLSIPIFYWVYHIFKDIIKNINNTLKKSVWTSVFIALTVIFMFDTTYNITGMFLLWFISLGLAQREAENDN